MACPEWDAGMVRQGQAKGKKESLEKVSEGLGGFLKKAGLRETVLRAGAVDE